MNSGFTSEILSAILLLAVAIFPLIFILPFLQKYIAKFYYIALLPAIVLIIMPVNISAVIPWFLLGSWFEINSQSRLILASLVVMWIVLGFLFFKNHSKKIKNSFFASFFLLTMTGSFGTVLAADIITFFLFSTLMGYGFYGMLVAGADKAGDKATKSAGRIYLTMMIIADLILFEVLLIAGLTTDNMSFNALHQAIVQSDYLTLYLVLIIISFAIKAGIWPLHFWLIRASNQVQVRMGLLFLGIPVVIALLAMSRWLPLGEQSTLILGLILQAMGLATLIYAILRLFSAPKNKSLANMQFIYGLFILSSFIVIIIGAGLSYAETWNSLYSKLLPYLFAGMILTTTVLLITSRNIKPTNKLNDFVPCKVETWPNLVIYKIGNISTKLQASWNTWFEDKIQQISSIEDTWQNSTEKHQKTLHTWPVIITVFILLFSVVMVILLFETFA